MGTRSVKRKSYVGLNSFVLGRFLSIARTMLYLYNSILCKILGIVQICRTGDH